jgi:hypothetical protein
MKVWKQWNDYCHHDIFFVENKDGVFVWYSYDRYCCSKPPGERGVKTGWCRCDYNKLPPKSKRILIRPMTPSNELEFLVLTGQTIEASMKRDGYELKAS